MMTASGLERLTRLTGTYGNSQAHSSSADIWYTPSFTHADWQIDTHHTACQLHAHRFTRTPGIGMRVLVPCVTIG